MSPQASDHEFWEWTREKAYGEHYEEEDDSPPPMSYFSRMVFYTNPCGHKTLVTDTFREFAEQNNVNACRKCNQEEF